MWLLLDNNNNVSWLNPWVLICLTMEHILLVVRCTLVDLNVYDFLLLDDFFAVAELALVFLVNDFTCASAVIAGPA